MGKRAHINDDPGHYLVDALSFLSLVVLSLIRNDHRLSHPRLSAVENLDVKGQLDVNTN